MGSQVRQSKFSIKTFVLYPVCLANNKEKFSIFNLALLVLSYNIMSTTEQ